MTVKCPKCGLQMLNCELKLHRSRPCDSMLSESMDYVMLCLVIAVFSAVAIAGLVALAT